MLNYRQLHYFWVVARTGSITRASEQLNLTPQTISGQITLLEQTYNLELFQRVGRQLELTETGRQTLAYAEQMFQIGGELEALLRAGPQEQILFRVGVADVVPKSIVYRLLAPTMELDAALRINCREDKLERLLADLAIQRLDLVISDSPMPSHLDIKGYSQKLGECGLSFFATPALARQHASRPFPACLDEAPLLVPGQETVVRSRLLRWLAEQQVQPRIVGEFDDSALMQAFGQSGSGIFVAPSVIAEEVCRQYGVQLIGQTEAVLESFYAISVERKVKHPGIVAITEGARRELFHW